MKKEEDSFCIYPFRLMNLRSTGSVRPCCAFESVVSKDGKPMALLEHSIDEIWNSEHLRGIRRAMVEGRTVPECDYCARETRLGFDSIGKQRTAAWAGGWLNETRLTVEELKAQAARDGYRIEGGPEWLDFHVGNPCNLKCRMCTGYYSSAIAADPVHARWDAEFFPPEPKSGDWFRQKDYLYGEVLRDPSRVRTLNLIGGEPLLVKEVREIMRHLVDTGAAKNILLSLTTNATRVDDEWCELASRFKFVAMAASVDGVGAVNDYIRFPSRWAEVEAGIARLRASANTYLYLNATVQAYNIFDVVPLVRWCDERGLDFKYNFTERPPHLSALVLPEEVRRAAADAMRAFVGAAPRKDADYLLRMATALERGAPGFGPERLDEFMRFTNDLDASRGQSFAAAFPELRERLARAGTAWSADGRFA